MRLFLAINLEPATRRSVYDAAAGLRAAAPQIGWTEPDRLHMTLKFLGERPDEAVAAVAEAMDAVSREHRCFHASLLEFGGFPNLRRVRVVFMSMDRDPRLELLHHDVEVACERIGYPVEGRAFRPHITVARVREPIPRDTLRALRCELARSADGVLTTTVRSIDLMRSARQLNRPVYELVHASALRES